MLVIYNICFVQFLFLCNTFVQLMLCAMFYIYNSNGNPKSGGLFWTVYIKLSPNTGSISF